MKNKKNGFTLAELLIAMVLLSIIMAAVSAIFSVALKNYQVSFAQSGLQKDVNLVVDSISRDIKQSVAIPKEYGEITRSSTTLILALPSIDENQNFIYNADLLEKDFIIYQKINEDLHKIVFANPASTRYQQNNQNKIIMENVSDLSFIYTPVDHTTNVNFSLSVSILVSKTNLEITAESTANRRNDE
ncbi:MAG: prepilin-type N-terminal cleavage/methylation domain-containing protein [Patescibacteria group bacterium]|nr:prepilin-type N-terminal cleavage/methylation domain-containing protein [Patescibacteria group bacterium]